MFVNYFKIAVRNIYKYRGYAAINIAGLSLGIACATLILLWVWDELSFDRFHEKADSIYRVEEDQHYSGRIFHTTVTPYPSAPVWKEDIPEVVEAVRVGWAAAMLMRHQEKAFYENAIQPVDPAFFKMFTFPFLQGNAETALNEPFSIVLTEETAEKYFPGENPIGKVINANDEYDFIVTGVVANVPDNSHLEFDMLVPFDFTRTLGWYSDNWGNNSIRTFVELQENAAIADVNQKLTEIVHRNNEDSDTDFVLMKFTDIHLHAYAGYERRAGDIQYVYIFSVAGLFVLLLACVNFMNLTTARSANRAKEIGMRKVSGASRKHIALQFLGESVLMALSSLALAVIAVALVLPAFNAVSGKSLAPSILFEPTTAFGLLFVALFTGFVSGSYPAFFLSGFQPVNVLKGSLKLGARSGTLRKVLVVMQFSLSVLLLIGTFAVYRQLHFMKSKDLGYAREQLLYITLRGETRNSFAVLKEKLIARPEILGVSGSGHSPTRVTSNSGGSDWDGKDPELELLISGNQVSYDYVETMGIKLAAGRDFSPSHPSDVAKDSTAAFLINRKLANIMAADPMIGARLDFWGYKGHVIGVMEDFHFNSVRTEIEPLALRLSAENLRHMIIRARPGNIEDTVDAIKTVWRSVAPNYPFELKFFDEDLDRMYRAEQRMSDILKYFSVLAIIISSLGLLGLASFLAEQRTKEIGVRKVLGASAASIVVLLSREFTSWVLLANAIAWPLSYFVLSNWLQSFAYRIELGWVIFAGAGLVALFVAVLTVSSQALKSAVMNPAEALRYE